MYKTEFGSRGHGDLSYSITIKLDKLKLCSLKERTRKVTRVRKIQEKKLKSEQAPLTAGCRWRPASWLPRREKLSREPGGAALGDVPSMEIADPAGKALMEATRHAGR